MNSFSEHTVLLTSMKCKPEVPLGTHSAGRLYPKDQGQCSEDSKSTFWTEKTSGLKEE